MLADSRHTAGLRNTFNLINAEVEKVEGGEEEKASLVQPVPTLMMIASQSMCRYRHCWLGQLALLRGEGVSIFQRRDENLGSVFEYLHIS